MILRIYYAQLGGHIHCRVFLGKAKNMTFQKLCDITLDAGPMWDDFRDMMNSSAEFIPDSVEGRFYSIEPNLPTWECGCGHINGSNLATCALCGRRPGETP